MIRLICLVLCFIAVTVIAAWPSSASEQQNEPRVEGCVTCHGMIEPMHKYGTTETFEKLKDGKDAVGLSCTACHGGNPCFKP